MSIARAFRMRWTIAWAASCLALAACGDDGAPSDQELIERFIADVTGQVDDAYVSRALGYLDLERHPLDVRVPRLSGVYTLAQRDEIVGQFERGMRQRFHGTEIGLRSDRVEIEGDRAEVTLGLMTAVGPLGARITLRKTAPGTWKVARVHIDR